MKLAAIDIGSNSVHMIIVQASSSHSFEVMDREKEMVKLGAGAFRLGHLSDEAYRAGLGAMRKYQKLAERHGVDEVIAVATSAVREAANGGDFLDTIEADTGITPRVISGEEEARLIYLAVRSAIDLSQRKALMIDIGGGSVEAIVGDARSLSASQSLKLGVQRLRDLFGADDPLQKKVRKELEAYVRERAEPALARMRASRFDVAVGTSGTILSLGMAANLRRGKQAWKSPNGQVIRLDELKALAEHLAQLSSAERARVPGVDEQRADTIHLGGLLLVQLLEVASIEAIALCDSALREGLVLDYLERARDDLRVREAVPDIRRRSVLELARRFGQADRHSDKVSHLALQIFDQTQSLHRLGHIERRLLEHAAILHDVGQHIRFERHEHHSYYLIRNSDLRGFTEDEIELIALIARYHRKVRPKRRHREYGTLKPVDRNRVRWLAGILRIADGLDRSHFQVVTSVNCEASAERLVILVRAQEDAELEIWAARRKADLLAQTAGLVVDIAVEAEPQAATTSEAARTHDRRGTT